MQMESGGEQQKQRRWKSLALKLQSGQEACIDKRATTTSRPFGNSTPEGLAVPTARASLGTMPSS